MAIVHIVLVRFKSDLDAAAVYDACNQFLNLKTKAIHPQSGKPYIQNITGGKNTSPEGHDGGFTHGFTVIFGSEEDREYYLKEDPAHAEFAKYLRSIIEKAVILDYEPESF